MKFLLTFLIVISELFGVTLSLNSAKENGVEYAILHIRQDKPFTCHSIPQGLDKEVYLCQFDKILKAPLRAKNMKLAQIDFLEKEKEFFIRVTPKVKSKLLPVGKPLYEDKEVSDKEKIKDYTHWVVLLYTKFPYIQTKSDDGIDFPVIYPKEEKPYVGALDLNGAPIAYAQSQDIKEYLDLKKSFENKKYQDVLEDSLTIIKKYPDTIFKAEILLYRIKALDALLDENSEDIASNFDRNDEIKEARQWTRTFSSNEHLPEVLMFIAKSYLNMGQKSDANYFLDILISEHEDSKYTKQAILLFADSLYKSKDQAKALKLYKDVLYSTKDLDVAAQAAIRLANKEVENGAKEQAREYMEKVLQANAQYLLKDKEGSYTLAKKLASKGLYDLAAKIADILFEGSTKRDENRELYLKDAGIWFAKASDVNPGYKRLQQYLKEYKSGEYIDKVQEALDELFFELKETNATKLENYYNELINKYQNKIGDRAIVEKAKLLLKEKRYSDVLKMQSALLRVSDDNNTQINNLVNQAASALTKGDMKDNDCLGAVKYMEEYKLEENSFEANKVYECFMRTSRFIKAKELSEMKIQSKNLKEKLKWLENYLASLYRLNRYEKVIEVSSDIFTLAQNLKQKVSFNTFKDTFFSYKNLKRNDKALEIADLLEKTYPNDFKNVDIYNAIVQEALDLQDDLLLVKYAQKVISLQEKYKNYVQTPNIEFHYINALKRLGRNKEALESVKELLKRDLSPRNLSKAYYYGAEVSLKQGQNTQAKEYFQKCTQSKEKNSWQDICEQNLKLLN
jgi:hypothetical protein